jgi:CHAT domain-containing protein/Tfp pilus assembly protein PilF
MQFRGKSAVAAIFAVAPLLAFALGLCPPACAQPGTGVAGADAAPALPAEVQAKLGKLQADLNAAHHRRNAQGEARTLNAIGDLYFMVSAYQQAEDQYGQAQALARAGKDAHQQAAALNGVANCYRVLSQNDKALATYQQALDVATASGDLLGQATALNGMGLVNANTSQYQKALELHNRALTLAQTMKDEDLEAQVEDGIADVHNDLGETQKAFDGFSQALTMLRNVGDRDHEADAVGGRGLVYSGMGEPKKAVDDYNQALSIYREVGDRDGEAIALGKLAIVASIVGEPRKALDYFSQALPIFQKVGDRASEATVLTGLGMISSDVGEPRKALEYYGQGLPLYREVGDRVGMATALLAMGQVSAGLGEPSKALDYFSQALPIYREVSARNFEATTLNNIGSVYAGLGEPQKALDYYNQSLPMERELGDAVGEASTLTRLGSLYKGLGEPRKALDYLNQALPIFRKANRPNDEAATLNDIGLVYGILGEPQKALDYLNQTLALRRQVGDRDGEAGSLSNIGFVYSGLGEPQKELDYYNQALPTFRQVQDRDGEASMLNNIGAVYNDLDEPQKALDYFNQALPIRRAVGDRDGEAVTLFNIASAHRRLGEPQKALDYGNQALLIFQKVGNRDYEAATLNFIGSAYSGLGDLQKALDYHNQALGIFQTVGDRDGEALTLNNIGFVYRSLGDPQKALGYLNQALPIAASEGSPLLEACIFYEIMLAQKDQRPTLAVFYGKQAVNFVQHVRGNIQGLDKEMQKSFLASKGDYYHDLADLLIGQGRLPEAQQVLDLLKQQEYADYVRGEKVDPAEPLSLTPAELEAGQDYQKSTAQLVSLGEQWSELKRIAARTPEQETQYQQLSGQLTKASQGMSDYYSRLYTLFGKDSDANKQVADVKGEAASLRQQIAKMPHTVALSTVVAKDRYSVIVITPATMVAREYPIAEKDLNQKVAAFEQVLRNPHSDARPAAQELYQILIGPVKADLDQARAETLVWSLDGVLRYVPIAALYDGKQYVVERYNTVTITPASIPHLSDKPDVSNLSAVAMGISRKYEESLPALPAVAGELDEIVKDAHVQGANGVLPGTVLLNGDFTEKAMENQLDGQHTVVHIASHFVFQPGDDSQSYLLLAGKEQAGDGFHLTVAGFRDDQNLSLDSTDLLTLSACETGMSGSASNGREVDGLGTTAQLKGAKAVISSLWEVNDASTGELMADFYKRWAGGAGKVMKVEALRQAQLDLLEGRVTPESGSSGRGVSAVENDSTAQNIPTGYAQPYYWAPFVLMGNWK